MIFFFFLWNYCKNVVNIILLIKIRWSYNSIYCCNKCSMIFVKKNIIEKFKNISVGRLKNIDVRNLKNITIMNCKVEFNQPFCWLYSVLNLLVIQYLETLYLGENHVRVMCERVWRKAQKCAIQQGLATGSRNCLTAGKSPKQTHIWSM